MQTFRPAPVNRFEPLMNALASQRVGLGRPYFGAQRSAAEAPRNGQDPGATERLSGLLQEALDQFEGPSARALSPFGQRVSAVSLKPVLQALSLAMARLNQPPREVVLLERPGKILVAQRLAAWMEDTLSQQQVQVAVVARQGGLAHREHDVTGMLHSGIVWRAPWDQRWKIYNLLDYQQNNQPYCQLKWTDPVDFFYQQGGYHPQALLLIPSEAVQRGMGALLLNGGFQRLAFTNRYNLLSPPHSAESLNCNKWVLLNVLAATRNTEDPAALLADIRKNYYAAPLSIDPLTRLLAGWHPQVRGGEVSWLRSPVTVTVESLLRSRLFERHLFCSSSGSPL